jgi:DNA-binding transcriptional regulator YiaG
MKGGRLPRKRYTPAQARKIRERTGLSVTGFAKKYGLAKSTISQWENGKRKIVGTAARFYYCVENHPE